MAGKVVTMQTAANNDVWTINKRLREGDEFTAMRHRVKVKSVIEWKGEYSVARVEVLGPVIDPMTNEPVKDLAPLRFDGRFGR